MRIVAGKFRGRNLVKSDHLKSLRPTTDKNREALFNILNSAKFLAEIDFNLTDANVLDVCCGSGSVAFEALSRGAKSATLIENDSLHLELAQKNSLLLGVENQVKILRLDAKKLPKNDEFFDLVFVDPPYSEEYPQVIESLLENSWIKKSSLLVVEFPSSNEPDFSPLRLLHSRRYGITSFAFLLCD